MKHFQLSNRACEIIQLVASAVFVLGGATAIIVQLV